MQKIMSIGALFVGLTLASLAVPPEIQALSIAMQADTYKTTRARVTDQRTNYHGKGPSTEVVTFDYRVGQKLYHGDNHLTQFDDSRREINERIYREEGHKMVDVYYDPKHPERVLLHRDVGLVVPIVILLVTAVCLIAGVRGYLDANRADSRAEAFRKAREQRE
jgi:hypothetical protein